jgi:hypothetical protein
MLCGFTHSPRIAASTESLFLAFVLTRPAERLRQSQKARYSSELMSGTLCTLSAHKNTTSTSPFPHDLRRHAHKDTSVVNARGSRWIPDRKLEQGLASGPD